MVEVRNANIKNCKKEELWKIFEFYQREINRNSW